MFIGIQVGLVVVGLYVMIRGRFDLGDREVTNPIASLVGIVLVAQLPLALLISIALRFTDVASPAAAPVPSRAGTAPATVAAATPEEDPNWWVDPVITCGALLLAAGMTAVGMRSDDEYRDVYASLKPAPDAGPDLAR
jgi:hypothetical protein